MTENMPQSMKVPTRDETQAKMDLVAMGHGMHTPEQSFTIADRFEQLAQSQGSDTFLIDGDRKVTFSELNAEANRYARLVSTKGLGPGDTAALMIQNRPEFFFAWVGICKAGATTAMINTFARDKALSHALDITNSKLLFVGEECLENFSGQQEALSERSCYAISDGLQVNLPIGVDAIGSALADLDTADLPANTRHGLTGKSPAECCFTSGTTGLPKAAVISHARWLGVGCGWQKLMGTTKDDVFYCVLPLFHGAAGMSLTSHALAAGCPIVLRRKFSASRFWPEVRRYGVTTTQYVGEIARYLINLPPQSDDREHTLKHMTGAGMTNDVWQKFLDRYGDIAIHEGLGATESNCGFTNVDCYIGAVGRIPYRDRTNATSILYDLENECHTRNGDGFSIPAKTGEVGELIGRILDLPGVMGGRFEGYTDADSSEKKILRNVFLPGDAWFSTGDLVRYDENDYFYFVDRIGDTYRWKSENVSTAEATDALGDYTGAELINLYGVAVPDHEGRAGMAAIQMCIGQEFNPAAFYEIATEKLPHYAVPLFLRVSEQSDLTPTWKLRKVDLQKQGYNPHLVGEPLYLLDRKKGTYSPYSAEGLEQLNIKPFE